MSFLIAAVVFVGMLCTLDLVLTLGVIKRLREHSERLSGTSGPGSRFDTLDMAVGEEVGEFATSTVDGERLTRGMLAADTLVAFFAPGCQPCREKMPAFVDHARALPGGRAQVVAVVVGDPAEAAAFVTELSPVARVVVEEGPDEPLSAAFRARSFPTLLRVSPHGDGRVLVTANRIALDRPVTAAR
ncbi:MULTISPECIES: TlpA disulfide reductase family protein [unclassified Streptomyces]|uniref:TlpA family protein disulfide reductase n=1 Tax=Streptomyces siderophoricus TaxID=2802281 RepID=A0ABS1MSJ0_9ACTN|nr:TlpA disulfide reductase family protein [Streptomyces sp. 9-7]MBL1090752.1 TlpA family protein disulfide reductase [Streptomyces sp. 9-7]